VRLKPGRLCELIPGGRGLLLADGVDHVVDVSEELDAPAA